MQRSLRFAASHAPQLTQLSSLRSNGASAAVCSSPGPASGAHGRGLRLRCFAAQSTAAMDAIKKLMKDPGLFKTQALIAGEWADAADGDTVDVRTAPLLCCLSHPCLPALEAPAMRVFLG